MFYYLLARTEIHQQLGTSAKDSAVLSSNMGIASLQAKLLGGDAEEAKKAAENAADVLKAIPGLDVSVDFNFS